MRADREAGIRHKIHWAGNMANPSIARGRPPGVVGAGTVDLPVKRREPSGRPLPRCGVDWRGSSKGLTLWT